MTNLSCPKCHSTNLEIIQFYSAFTVCKLADGHPVSLTFQDGEVTGVMGVCLDCSREWAIEAQDILEAVPEAVEMFKKVRDE